MKRAVDALVLVLVVVLDPLRAHAETRPRYGGSVEATLLGAPVSLDPVAARTHAEATVDELLYDTLYRIGPDGVAQPHLAVTSPITDDKHTTVRIAIRRGVKFHDGTEVTAQDVAASLERARGNANSKWALAPIFAIRIDGDAIELTLRAPVAELVTLLALPQTAVTKAGNAPGDKPIGSGPYAFENLDRAHHSLQLRAFDDHFAGRPYVDQLVLRWYDTADGEARKFETGAAQLSARGVAAFAGAQPAFRADDVEGPAALLVFIGFGRRHPEVTKEPAFRRALDLALARGGLATIGSGERVVPTRLPVPIEAGAIPLSPTGRADDLTAAAAQLAIIAKKLPALAAHNLGALEILVEDTRPDDREIAERVVRALDKLGLQATITALPAQTLRDRVSKGECDLWIGQLAEPVTSQLAWWGAAFAAGNDDWPIAQLAAGALDLGAAATAFADREPIVPLMFRAVRMWHRTDVRGMAFDATGRPCYADMFLFGVPSKAGP